MTTKGAAAADQSQRGQQGWELGIACNVHIPLGYHSKRTGSLQIKTNYSSRSVDRRSDIQGSGTPSGIYSPGQMPLLSC
ncbi:hypothetical protein ACO22_04429 [Paracoccidioides brasiliensis]|uniref:Uncharacterized protein n=1 Tax=Paracoccidioides brasiliensis TaxID=121759 RepID=A0A1D2JDC8_PARBR|nr:hypothetical protein ACO22_04429 [Paracoccidioides brasiliensis]